ncbi:hypothetical protein [Roseicyclus elongatus]|uniref:hypothetical protein n=1 Tax=Roseicyclus elongatus TaxID=159346 RepID=UPI00046CC626|nr:hypothetical protein [Roseibacterium elongatum]
MATVSAAAERSAAPVTTQMAILPLSDARGELCQALCVLGEGACRVSGPPPCRWRIAQMTRVALSAGQPVTPETARAQAGPRLRVIQGGKR